MLKIECDKCGKYMGVQAEVTLTLNERGEDPVNLHYCMFCAMIVHIAIGDNSEHYYKNEDAQEHAKRLKVEEWK